MSVYLRDYLEAARSLEPEFKIAGGVIAALAFVGIGIGAHGLLQDTTKSFNSRCVAENDTTVKQGQIVNLVTSKGGRSCQIQVMNGPVRR